ncbi:MAG: hypothetical protein LC632_07045 [Xanthomonadaceae bacterium]|nr:hypothetical protein [Xanthomonadaceae bacterium]
MKLTLLIPGLLAPPAPLAELAAALPPTPALRRMLAQADHDTLPINGICATIASLAELETLPAGALTALAAEEIPGDRWWLRVDPVHLAADADGLRLVHGEVLEVTDDEAASLTVFLATELELPLRRATPTHWYLEREPFAADTHRPEAVLGRRIEPLLPSGPDGDALRRWLNEVQMLLHAHPVNLRRADRGQHAINSIWPWGGGKLGAPGRWSYSMTLADDPALVGLALRHGGEAGAGPRGLAQVPTTGHNLVRLDEVYEATRLGDVERWLSALAGLERDWFAPARAMLADGALEEFVVLDCAGNRFTLRPLMRWRFWRGEHGLEAD